MTTNTQAYLSLSFQSPLFHANFYLITIVAVIFLSSFRERRKFRRHYQRGGIFALNAVGSFPNERPAGFPITQTFVDVSYDNVRAATALLARANSYHRRIFVLFSHVEFSDRLLRIREARFLQR